MSCFLVLCSPTESSTVFIDCGETSVTGLVQCKTCSAVHRGLHWGGSICVIDN